MRSTFLALFLQLLSGTAVFAQEFPFGRERGSVPIPNSTVLAVLDSVSPLTTSDTVHISSPGPRCPGPQPYKGTILGPSVAEYFGEYYPAQGFKIDDVYATRRVPMGPGLVGYLLRVPGMYSATVIDLWVYDRTSSAWIGPVEAAEDWADAGEWYQLQAWLVDVSGDGFRDLVRRGRHGYWDEVYWDTLALRALTSHGFSERQVIRDSTLRAVFNFDELAAKC